MLPLLDRLRRESTNLHASLEDLVNKSIRDDSSLTTAEEDTYHTIGDSAQEEDNAAAAAGGTNKTKQLSTPVTTTTGAGGNKSSSDQQQQPKQPKVQLQQKQQQLQSQCLPPKTPEVRRKNSIPFMFVAVTRCDKVSNSCSGGHEIESRLR